MFTIYEADDANADASFDLFSDEIHFTSDYAYDQLRVYEYGNNISTDLPSAFDIPIFGYGSNNPVVAVGDYVGTRYRNESEETFSHYILVQITDLDPVAVTPYIDFNYMIVRKLRINRTITENRAGRRRRGSNCGMPAVACRMPYLLIALELVGQTKLNGCVWKHVSVKRVFAEN